MSLRSIVLAAAIPLLVAVATIAAQDPDGPVLYADEMGYLAIGVELSTRDAAPSLAELEFYSPGYGAVLAPVLSVVDTDPWVVAVGANLLAIALLGPALLVLVREVFAPPPALATVAAIAGACAPSTVMQVTRAWPECLLALLSVLWAIALHRVLDRRGAVHGPLLVGLAVASFMVHRRSVVLLLVSAVVLALHHGIGAFRARDDVRGSLRDHAAWATAAAAVGVGGFAAASAFDAWTKDRLYRGADLVNATERAGELAGEDLARRLVAGVWSLSHATFGLAVVAVVALVTMAVTGRRRTWAAAVLVTLGGAVALSVLVIADGPRVDHLLYERYVAPVAVVAVAVAVAWIGEIGRRPVLATGAVVALPVLTVATSVTLGPDDFEGLVQKLTIPALSSVALVTGGAGDAFVTEIALWPIAAVATAVLAAVLAVARWRPAIAGGAVVAAFAVTAVAGSALSLRPNLEFWERYAQPLTDGIDANGAGGGPFGVAPGTPDGVMIVLQYRSGYPEVVPVDDVACPDVPVVVGPPDFAPVYPVSVVAESDLPGAVLVVPRC